MDAKHTPGPWRLCRATGEQGEPLVILPPDGNRRIAQLCGRSDAANGRRVVACVNACQGINPEAVPELLAALRRLLSTIPQGRDDCDCSSCADERFARAALERAEAEKEVKAHG